MTIMQHKISEDKRVLLPSMVCMDGFHLSHVYERDILTKEQVRGFLPRLQSGFMRSWTLRTPHSGPNRVPDPLTWNSEANCADH